MAAPVENVLSDQSKFQKTTVNDDDYLDFIISQEKRIDKTYKKLVDSNSLSEKTWWHLQLVETKMRLYVFVL